MLKFIWSLFSHKLCEGPGRQIKMDADGPGSMSMGLITTVCFLCLSRVFHEIIWMPNTTRHWTASRRSSSQLKESWRFSAAGYVLAKNFSLTHSSILGSKLMKSSHVCFDRSFQITSIWHRCTRGGRKTPWMWGWANPPSSAFIPDDFRKTISCFDRKSLQRSS